MPPTPPFQPILSPSLFWMDIHGGVTFSSFVQGGVHLQTFGLPNASWTADRDCATARTLHIRTFLDACVLCMYSLYEQRGQADSWLHETYISAVAMGSALQYQLSPTLQRKLSLNRERFHHAHTFLLTTSWRTPWRAIFSLPAPRFCARCAYLLPLSTLTLHACTLRTALPAFNIPSLLHALCLPSVVF